MRLLIGIVLLTALVLAEQHLGTTPGFTYPGWLPFLGLILCGIEDIANIWRD